MDAHNNYKVLIIEDNQMFRSLALRMLPDCKKYCALTYNEGIEMFQKITPDITFLDIGLPDGSGLDLLREMKALIPNTFIVMLTQSRVPEDVETALKNGAAGYIAKPFSQKEMLFYFERYGEFKKTGRISAIFKSAPIESNQNMNQTQQGATNQRGS